MAEGIFNLGKQRVLIGQCRLAAVTVSHGSEFAVLRVVEKVFFARLLGKHELIVFVLLHLAEHTGGSLVVLTKLGVGVCATVAGLDDHVVNLVDAVAHLVAE